MKSNTNLMAGFTGSATTSGTTLPDGCSILVNHEVSEPEDGKIFVIRAGDELIVKRTLQLRSGRWAVASDNPDTKTWPTQP